MIQRHLGLRYGRTGSETRQLQKVLAERMAVKRHSCAEYLTLAETDPAGELAAWASGLTVNETYFLRHIEQFRALTGTVMPARRAAGADHTRLRLLSAGCATGEEAYSLAIALRQDNPGAQPSILGVDVDPDVLAIAEQARYTTWSLRALPDGVRERWFSPAGDDVQVDPSIRSLVRFEQRNISEDDPSFWRPQLYDAVFCRNVLMYLAPEVMAQVVARICRSLVPGGFLFLGSAETLRGMSAGFQLRESHGAFYYQRTDGAGPAWLPAERSTPELIAMQRPSATPGPAPGRPVAAQATPEGSPEISPGIGPDLDIALDLLRLERFGQALAAVDVLLAQETPGADGDPERLLLRAALLTHMGDLRAAESTCQELITRGRPRAVCAGAHLLLAQSRESARDVDGAVGHGRAAAGLDPEFAMPHVHLGRLARRIGRLETARRHYLDSLRLLPAETGHRMMLFGGGFDRQALISVCRTQLTQIEQLIPPPRSEVQR